ncbi:lysophospholipid acyltransferase family protein [Oricola sp.]|uniref:lysophospholipid acyltransferase family protein n=1 Tax=Oricola sp. TaxID=1979950 RepID=UPI003BA85C96
MRVYLRRSPVAIYLVSAFLVTYLRLVYRTNRLVHFDSAYADEIAATRTPFIVTCWHGQHFMVPFFQRAGHPSVLMVSRSNDAELNARVVEMLGFDTVRASGGRVRRAAHRKGAVSGLIAMRNHLRAGRSVSMIADIPHGTAREAGMGIINLARMSGAPIVPVAYASSRRFVFENAWDKAALNLPFGHAAFCIGDLIEVPADADEDTMEEQRARLEAVLNRVTKEAESHVETPR